MFSSNKISKHNLHSNMPYKPSTAYALHSFCIQDKSYLQAYNYIAATHNMTHSPCTSTCTTHPLPKLALLRTQLTQGIASCQNGTRCRDGVKVLWCHSHLVWLVFESSIPTCACFHSENFLVTCSNFMGHE